MFDPLICIILVINVILLVINISNMLKKNDVPTEQEQEKVDPISSPNIVTVNQNEYDTELQSKHFKELRTKLDDVKGFQKTLIGIMLNTNAVKMTITKVDKTVTIKGVEYEPKSVIVDDVVCSKFKYDPIAKKLIISDVDGDGVVQLNNVILSPDGTPHAPTIPNDITADTLSMYNVSYEPAVVRFDNQEIGEDYIIKYSKIFKSLTVTKKDKTDICPPSVEDYILVDFGGGTTPTKIDKQKSRQED